MLRKKTVIVVGAGASNDLGFPLGPKLKSQVSGLLRDDQDIFRYLSSAAERYFEGEWPSPHDIVERARSLRHQIESSASIDNFLDQHRDEKGLVSFVKMVIAYALADAEKNSALSGVNSGPGMLRHRRLSEIIAGTSDYFLYEFLNILIRGHQSNNFSQSMENLTFIIFNYDRCIERYLDIWFKFRFGEDIDWRRSGPKFIHVYGSLGDYFDPKIKNPFIEPGDLPFQNPHFELPNYVERIKIFTEQEDSQTYDDIQNAQKNADAMIFLGFGFEEQNMRFFNAQGVGATKRVFATVFGMSEVNKEHIKNELANLYSPHSRNVLTVDGKSKSLIDECYMPLTKAVGSL